MFPRGPLLYERASPLRSIRARTIVLAGSTDFGLVWFGLVFGFVNIRLTSAQSEPSAGTHIRKCIPELEHVTH